jgi:hypothetical protein
MYADRNSTPANIRNENRELRRRGMLTSILKPFGIKIAVFITGYWPELERTEGVEPSPPIGKIGALPLSYVRESY